MRSLDNLRSTLDYLPTPVSRSLRQLPERTQQRIQEVRLRIGRPVSVTESGTPRLLAAEGVLTGDAAAALKPTSEDLARSYQAIMSYSVYSHEQDTAEGFVTIRGGCRVGLCGSAVRQGETVSAVRSIAGLNFRIAGELPGIAASVWQQVQGSILVAGPAGSGKTTFLRDLARLAGNSVPTALIDERGELAAVYRGMPQHDVGMLTDVFDGYPRAAGILTALRVMTPSCIVCDEIGTGADADALLQAAGCGAMLLASAHAGSMEELMHRGVLQPLLEAHVFAWAVLLHQGRVQTLRRL